MKTKLLLLCAAAAVCMPSISFAQEGLAIRILESGSEKLAQQGGTAAGVNLLIGAEKGLGAAGTALNAAAGRSAGNSLSYPGAKASGFVTEDKVRKAVRSAAAGVSKPDSVIREKPVKFMQQIEQTINDNIAALAKTAKKGSSDFASIEKSREILEILKTKGTSYLDMIKNTSAEKPEFLTFNELASVLILQRPKEFIAYTKESTAGKYAPYYPKFVGDMMKTARTDSPNFLYQESRLFGSDYFFYGAVVPNNVPKEDILKELFPTWYVGEQFQLSTIISQACEAEIAGEPKTPSMYLIYEIPIEKQYLQYHIDELLPHYPGGEKFVLDTRTIPGTAVYKFNPFTMTWELYGNVN